jgi:uncharacterized membrane protein
VSHLIHPFLVHFSVAFLTAGTAIGLWGAVRRREMPFATPLVVAGTLSLLVTIASGYLAANTTLFHDAARPVLDAHERNGWFVLGVFALGLFARAWGGGTVTPRWRPVYALWLGFGAALALRSAWFGGQLVYEHGIGVGL